jgi:endo-1,4-beta-xylanase
MPSLTSLFATVLAAASAVTAFPFNATELDVRQTISNTQAGTNNGYYYSFWNAGGGSVQYQNLAQGEYKVRQLGSV